jgi:ABC-type transport system involved in multi-copper enzyme maturation permease subunit
MLMFTLGLFFLGLPVSGSVGRQFSKEFRQQMPGALVGLLGVMVIGWLGRGYEPWGLFFGGLSIIMIGAGAFGYEWDARTMTVLLTQPRGRFYLYLTKMLPMGCLLLLVTYSGLVSLAENNDHWVMSDAERRSILLIVFLPGLLAFSSGPFFALLARGTLAGGLFGVVVPGLIVGCGNAALGWLYRLQNGVEPMGTPPYFVEFLFIAGFLYILATAILSWRLFSRLQVREGGPGSESIHGIMRPLDWLLRIIPARPGGVTSALVRKELRLHLLPWLLAIVYLVLAALLWVGANRVEEVRDNFKDLQVVAACGFGVLIVMTTGAAVIAEERQLGTLDWQLTSPVSVYRQWWTKFGVGLVLALVLGVALPQMVLQTVLGSRLADFNETFDGTARCIATGLAIGLFALATFASSLTRSTARAATAAAAIGLATGALTITLPSWVLNEFSQMLRQGDGVFVPHSVFGVMDAATLESVTLVWAVVAPMLLAVAWTLLAANNYRAGAPTGRRCYWQTGVVSCLPLALGVLTAGLIIMRLEVGLR